jgi:hypothetical protein
MYEFGPTKIILTEQDLPETAKNGYLRTSIKIDVPEPFQENLGKTEQVFNLAVPHTFCDPLNGEAYPSQPDPMMIKREVYKRMNQFDMSEDLSDPAIKYYGYSDPALVAQLMQWSYVSFPNHFTLPVDRQLAEIEYARLQSPKTFHSLYASRLQESLNGVTPVVLGKDCLVKATRILYRIARPIVVEITNAERNVVRTRPLPFNTYVDIPAQHIPKITLLSAYSA